MKKFGTPIGAGPGSANEKVGLAGVGMPLLVIGGGGVTGLAGFFDFFLAPGAVVGSVAFLPAWAVPGLSLVGFWPRRPEPVFGGVDLIVVVGVDDEEDAGPDLGFGALEAEVEVEVEIEVVVELVCTGVVVVTVAGGVVTVVGGQDSDELVIAAPGGSGRELGGVPGGTFWKVRV